MPDPSSTAALVRPRGHEEAVAGLAASARQGTLPHALLFTGEEGIGKYRAALWLAATLLCDRGGSSPCLECGPCLRVQRGSHADVFIVDHHEHGQNAITVDFIAARESRSREAYQGPPVEAFLALRSAEGRGKFVIVREAEAMLEEAQNAFLKTLEEPRPGVHILLECSSPDRSWRRSGAAWSPWPSARPGRRPAPGSCSTGRLSAPTRIGASLGALA